jgi:GAF domain-containing protein
MSEKVEEQIKEKKIDVIFFGGAKVPLSWVGVPIIYGNQILGVISAQSTTQPGLYREFERDLLTTVASQAAIAIENARSFQTTQRRAEREATINAISQKIQSATSVEGAIQTAIEELGRTLNAKRTTVTMTPKVTDHGK